MRRTNKAMTIGAVLLGAAAASVYAAFLLRVTLNRTAGEDPSVSAACPSVADDGNTMECFIHSNKAS